MLLTLLLIWSELIVEWLIELEEVELEDLWQTMEMVLGMKTQIMTVMRLNNWDKLLPLGRWYNVYMCQLKVVEVLRTLKINLRILSVIRIGKGHVLHNAPVVGEQYQNWASWVQ